ncbi:unnamed protein product [Leptosia nina]|uniref:Shugoshin C-terminal domain-containing protein n=1 Tax=Leptosia nina TaxID=320188 RepID=A0AAV1K0F5_9NEOP
MNSRSGVNESNLVNLSAELSTLNQLDTKDGLLSFPFDHIYACHSDTERPMLQLEKEVEVSTHCVVADDKVIGGQIELTKLQEHINALESENKSLKKLVAAHLELVQYQNEAITKKDRQNQTLRKENDALKAKYLREDPGVNVSSTTTAINAAFLALQDSATGSPGQLTISKIVENRFPDLLGTTKEVTSEPAEFKETFGLAGPSSHPELIAKYSQDPDPFPQARSDDPPTQSAKMINSKRSPARKDVRKDVKEMKSEPKSKNKKKKPVAPKAQRNNKKGNRNSGCTRAVKPKITETTIAHNRLRLFDTTPTGEEDPYQLGEADMREQSPIPKLMFNKQSRPRRSSTRYNSPHENATQYSVGYGRTPKQKSAVSEDQDEDVDVEVVRTDPLDSDPDWCANNEKNFTYRYKRTTSPMLNADALQPENLAISNSATLDHMDYTVARPVAQVKNEEAAANKRATSGRGRKRASSSPGVPKRGKRKPCTVKQTRG